MRPWAGVHAREVRDAADEDGDESAQAELDDRLAYELDEAAP